MPKINQTTWIVALSTIDSGIIVEPEVPGIVTITNPEGGTVIYFTAGTEGTSPITSYVATSVPEGPTLTVVSADLAVGGYVELSDFTYDTDYIVSISAVNKVGQGEAAYTNSFDVESEVPGIVTITNPEGGEIINFTAGTEGTSPITGYVASVIPSGPTATVVSADLAVGGYVELSNFTFDTDYIVSVSAVNEVGQGEAAYTNSFDFASPYNSASGGTETVVNDYNGTGEQWMVHTFTSSGTLDVISASQTFRALLSGGAGGGGGGNGGLQGEKYGGSGGGAEVLHNDLLSLTVGGQSITAVGVGGGSGAGNATGNGSNGGSGSGTTFTPVGTARPGSAGAGAPSGSNGASGSSGNGYAGSPANGNQRGGGTIGNYNVGPNGLTSDIDGETKMYGAGGFGATGTLGYGNGGGGGAAYSSGAAGQAGAVIVSYQIGVSTLAQIKVAQAVRKAELRKQQLEEKALKKQQALEAKLRK